MYDALLSRTSPRNAGSYTAPGSWWTWTSACACAQLRARACEEGVRDQRAIVCDSADARPCARCSAWSASVNTSMGQHTLAVDWMGDIPEDI
jgi:hypothetical protein